MVDLTDRSAASAVLSDVQPDVVVNLAAETSVDGCERDPNGAYRTNVRLVENLAGWIRDGGAATHLIQLSTDQNYDGGGPHREDDVTILNTYGFSKYAGELAAASVDATVLRTNLFGRSRCGRRKTISDWVVDSLRSRTPITLFADVLFSPVSLRRLSDVITSAVVRPVPGVFNVGSHGGMSKADFAFALAEALGLPTDRMTVGRASDADLAARRPSDMRMDPSHYEATFDATLPTLADEIAEVAVEYSTDT